MPLESKREILYRQDRKISTKHLTFSFSPEPSSVSKSGGTIVEYLVKQNLFLKYFFYSQKFSSISKSGGTIVEYLVNHYRVLLLLLVCQSAHHSYAFVDDGKSAKSEFSSISAAVNCPITIDYY